MYEDFHGEPPTKDSIIVVPNVRVALKIGRLLGVIYEARRDGKTGKYIHEFRRKSQPDLVASYDGLQLMTINGAYRFTGRGIVDQ